jgi:hypothetical protein
MPPRERIYRVFMWYDRTIGQTHYATTTSRQQAIEAGVAEFMRWLGEQEIEDIRAEKLEVKVTIVKEKENPSGD